MPTSRALLAAAPLVSALVLAGCGAERPAQRSGAARAALLPQALAQQLAAESDEVARSLAAGNGCAARSAAIRLRRQTIQAINAGHVPAAFQERLQSAANDLAGRIHCVAPSAATPRARPAPAREKPKHEDHGKHKGRAKHEGDGKGEGD
jgi:hypothetical protein